MSYAIRKDGQGWRAVNGKHDVEPDETFSETMPDIIKPDAANAIRETRAPLLVAADVAINKADDCGVDASTWRKYRQALRDITKQKTFPKSVTWPNVPE